MYSLILMAAMTTPADTPAWGFKHGCHGGRGSCTGSCTGGNACTGSHASCVGSHSVPVNGGCHGVAHGAVAAGPAAAPGYAGRGYSCGGCGGCGGKFLGWKMGGCWSDNGYKTSFACHGAGACYGYAYA